MAGINPCPGFGSEAGDKCGANRKEKRSLWIQAHPHARGCGGRIKRVAYMSGLAGGGRLNRPGMPGCSRSSAAVRCRCCLSDKCQLITAGWCQPAPCPPPGTRSRAPANIIWVRWGGWVSEREHLT